LVNTARTIGDIVRELPERFACTDTGNAERFAHQHRDKARYVETWKRWYFWDGTRWREDTTGAVQRLAKETARAINEEVMREVDDDRRKQLRVWAGKSEARAARENMIALARSEAGIATAPEAFDADHWALNVANGTLDLRTGELRPHRREDMITKIAPVAYDPNATAPRWDAFMHRVMDGNADQIAYLRRFVGYALTGVIREHAFAFSYGGGMNGKGVFHHTIARVLGEYANTASDLLFFVHKGDGGHPTSVASLLGMRFVLCSEVPADKRFNEPLIKGLTGGDAVRTRRLYENEWDLHPTAKLFFCGNHKPAIKGTDDGIWRRVRLIPWTVKIPAHEADPQLETKLEAELPGILAWAVRGCAEWRDRGLGDAPAVAAATAEYREESDPFAEFFRARCVFAPDAKVTRAALRREYEQWCGSIGSMPLGAKKLAEGLRRCGVTDGGTVRDSMTSAPVDAWSGVRLRSAM
jgi:putative DNA primase/helicase